jgi:hypothetical protein
MTTHQQDSATTKSETSYRNYYDGQSLTIRLIYIHCYLKLGFFLHIHMASSWGRNTYEAFYLSFQITYTVNLFLSLALSIPLFLHLDTLV